MLNVIIKEATIIKRKLSEEADMFVIHIVGTISQVYNYLQIQEII